MKVFCLSERETRLSAGHAQDSFAENSVKWYIRRRTNRILKDNCAIRSAAANGLDMESASQTALFQMTEHNLTMEINMEVSSHEVPSVNKAVKAFPFLIAMEYGSRTSCRI
uniref:Uncharacterized protein n=1 Tax=Salix viminalis TaxID=40686 RepID=A0A6N2KGY4_SALVM